MTRVNYLKEVEICESVRKTIKKIIAQNDDPAIRAKVIGLPSTESVLRAASVFSPALDTEEKLKDFITKHILSSLRLTEIQKEHLGLHAENRKTLEDSL